MRFFHGITAIGLMGASMILCLSHRLAPGAQISWQNIRNAILSQRNNI